MKAVLYQLWIFFIWHLGRVWVLFYPKSPPDSQKCFVLAAATDTLIGSKGDEAMLMATLGALREKGIQCVQTGVSTHAAEIVAQKMGFQPVWLSLGKFMPLQFVRSLRKAPPKFAYVMGADVMDGHYSIIYSLKMIIAADLMARMGTKVAFLGFSFNEKPEGMLRYAFRHLESSVLLNLRDPISLARFERYSGKSANLVADSAFLLKPAVGALGSQEFVSWLTKERADGRKIIGLNFHSLLFSKPSAGANYKEMLDSLKRAVDQISSSKRVSFVLFPHDNRKVVGDLESLSDLNEQISGKSRSSVFFVESLPSASEVKEIVASFDGVVTGRMHLAIAALGRKVPVCVFNYQGKFQGLFEHFQLPQNYIIDPSCSAEQLISCVESFIDELPMLQSIISDRYDEVICLSKRNFSNLS